MSDVVDSVTRSRMMSGIRGKNTKPELIVRRYLHRLGFRFRLHDKRLPGRPDIVLAQYRTVIDIRGCFWHCHEGCRYAATPKNNADFWATKLRGNVERDKRNTAALEAMGWRVLLIWECEVSDDDALVKLAETLRLEPLSTSGGQRRGS